jgi:hypothetical protein
VLSRLLLEAGDREFGLERFEASQSEDHVPVELSWRFHVLETARTEGT